VQIFPLLALSVAGVPCAVLGAILKGLTKILFGSKKCREWLRLPAGKNTHEHMGRIVPDGDARAEIRGPLASLRPVQPMIR
jgi:hypothetical protein